MYSNLKHAMHIDRIKITDLANVLSLHRNTISGKLNGKQDFLVSEAMAIHSEFFSRYDFRWLFRNSIQ